MKMCAEVLQAYSKLKTNWGHLKLFVDEAEGDSIDVLISLFVHEGLGKRKIWTSI